jgi:hypothetical protein
MGEHLVRIHLMTTGNSGDGYSELEGLMHYCELLLDRAPAALFGLGHNFNGINVRAGLKHRRQTTSKFKRCLVSGFRGGGPSQHQYRQCADV